MRLIDDAAAAAASRHAGHPALTPAVETMEFHSPARAYDLLTTPAELSTVGTTSTQVKGRRLFDQICRQSSLGALLAGQPARLDAASTGQGPPGSRRPRPGLRGTRQGRPRARLLVLMGLYRSRLAETGARAAAG